MAENIEDNSKGHACCPLTWSKEDIKSYLRLQGWFCIVCDQWEIQGHAERGLSFLPCCDRGCQLRCSVCWATVCHGMAWLAQCEVGLPRGTNVIGSISAAFQALGFSRTVCGLQQCLAPSACTWQVTEQTLGHLGPIQSAWRDSCVWCFMEYGVLKRCDLIKITRDARLDLAFYSSDLWVRLDLKPVDVLRQSEARCESDRVCGARTSLLLPQ